MEDPEINKVIKRELAWWFDTATDMFSDENGLLSFTDDQASYGTFGVEDFLRDHKVPFDLWNEPYIEDGFTLHYRPEIGNIYCNTNNEEIIDVYNLRKILQKNYDSVNQLRAEIKKILPQEYLPIEEYV